MNPRALAFVLLGSSAAAAAEEKINFQDHIRPIFESACNNCHNPDKKKGGLDLSSFAAMMAGGSSGEVLAAGSAGDSRLFASVARTAEPFMPPQGDPLGAKEMDLLKRWIEGGLLETANGVAKKAKKPAFSAQMAEVKVGKPDGPPPMPENLLLEPVVVTQRASATAALATSPWAPLVAISGQKQVLLYNTDNLELVGVLPYPEGGVESLMFSRNSQLLVAGVGRGGKSGKVVAWEVKTGKRVIDVGDERDTVLAADLSADQAVVALGGPSKRVKLLHTADGEVFKEIKKHTDWVTALQFSPDGVLLASGDRAGNAFVWEGASGNDFYTLAGHTGAITAISWRADGNIVATASEDGTIRLWEMNEGKEVKKWNAHGGGVQSMSFAMDGRLVSCGRDNTVKVWTQDGKQEAAQNQFGDIPLAACFTSDGGRFVVGDWSGRVSVWNSKDGKAAGEMSAAPPSIDQRLAALKPEVEKAGQQLATAKDTAGSMANNLAAARGQMEQAKQSVAAFNEKSVGVEQALAKAKAAADAVLARLNAPVPEPSPDAATMDMGTARALAEDLQNLTAAAKAAVVSTGNAAVATAQDFSKTVPGALAQAVATAKAKEAEMADWQKKADEAAKLVEASTAALEQHRRALARWEAAKVNAVVFNKRDELADLTAKLEEATADVAAREKTLAETPAALAAAPPEQKPALEKKLADAREGLDARKAEAAALQQQVEAAKKLIEAETARYLSMLPK